MSPSFLECGCFGIWYSFGALFLRTKRFLSNLPLPCMTVVVEAKDSMREIQAAIKSLDVILLQIATRRYEHNPTLRRLSYR